MITLLPGEQILLIRRRHWLPIVLESVTLAAVAFLPFFTLFILEALPAEIRIPVNQYLAYYLFFSSAWLLVLWIVFFVGWTNYYLDIILVTDKRVIDIEQITLFARDAAELRLDHIQDMKAEIVGFLPSLLNYGSLHIQTAGENKEIVIHNIHDPNGTKDLIAKQMEGLSKTTLS